MIAARSAATQSGRRSMSTLLQRSVLRVKGPDAVSFLNGFATNDLTKLEPKGAVFSAFLNAKGRTVFDAVAASPIGGGGSHDTSTVFLDVAPESVPVALGHLRRYKLRADVKIKDVSHKYGVAAWLPAGPAAPHDVAQQLKAEVGAAVAAGAPPKQAANTCILVDPRSPVMGVRGIIPKAAADGLHGSVGDVQTLTPADYTMVRWLAGVPEGIETEGYMPLEWGVDYLAGASFTKGCYLGQELMARTHFKGQVRKRAVPLLLLPPGAPAPPLLRAERMGAAGPWAAAALQAAAVTSHSAASAAQDAQRGDTPLPPSFAPAPLPLHLPTLAAVQEAVGSLVQAGGSLPPLEAGTSLLPIKGGGTRSVGRLLSTHSLQGGAVLGWGVLKLKADPRMLTPALTPDQRAAALQGRDSGFPGASVPPSDTTGLCVSVGEEGAAWATPYLPPWWAAVATDAAER